MDDIRRNYRTRIRRLPKGCSSCREGLDFGDLAQLGLRRSGAGTHSVGCFGCVDSNGVIAPFPMNVTIITVRVKGSCSSHKEELAYLSLGPLVVEYTYVRTPLRHGAPTVGMKLPAISLLVNINDTRVFMIHTGFFQGTHRNFKTHSILFVICRQLPCYCSNNDLRHCNHRLLL
jgi:hypothetical protein